MKNKIFHTQICACSPKFAGGGKNGGYYGKADRVKCNLFKYTGWDTENQLV